jgi:hypothetical protein
VIIVARMTRCDAPGLVMHRHAYIGKILDLAPTALYRAASGQKLCEPTAKSATAARLQLEVVLLAQIRHDPRLLWCPPS